MGRQLTSQYEDRDASHGANTGVTFDCLYLMRIGLNLLYLVPQQVGGTQTYAEQLIAAFARSDTDHEFVIYVNSLGVSLRWPQQKNFRISTHDFRVRSRAARYAYEQLVMPHIVRDDGIDLLHSLGYVSPLGAKCPSVVSIHDAIFAGYPMPATRRALLKFFVTRSAHSCDHILTLSDFSKKEIVHHMRVDAGKVSVIPLGPRPLPAESSGARAELKVRFNLDHPYILAFGGVSGHKNMVRLVKAFAGIAERFPHLLVIAGQLPPTGEVQSEVQQQHLASRVVLTSYLSDGYVMPLLAGADVFAFPSWYEGFGLPVLDAQQAGVAVACSHAASLPEVGGKGAEYFDPCSVDELANALEKIVSSRDRREQLVDAGFANVRRFSWSETARRTLEVYARVQAARSKI